MNSGQQTILISGVPAGIFSTLQREVSRGRLFSTRFSPEQAVVFDPLAGQFFRITSAGRDTAPPETLVFTLVPLTPPRNIFSLPGGPAAAASGTVEVLVSGQGPTRVVVRVTGLGPLPPGTTLTVWLLQDLLVPTALSAPDLSLLPRRAEGVNLPGGVFTVDGLPNRA